ncbi:MAG: thiamine phosphate synthase [Bacteroidales bacterium]
MLQFITHTHPSLSMETYVEQVLQGGGRWIQLRMKEKPIEDVRQAALQLLPLCKAYKAKLILDDHVALVSEVGADGVHLGKMDMSPLAARQLLGNNFIIGGTANTFADVKYLFNAGVDYIGLGPYQYTDTKKNLSTILGIQGYTEIMNAMKAENMCLPVVAIGGICSTDIPSLMRTGISGVALSGSILKAKDIVQTTAQIIDVITKNTK